MVVGKRCQIAKVFQTCVSLTLDVTWECQILHLWCLLVWLWMWLENVISSTCGVFKSDYGCDLRMSDPPLKVSLSLTKDVTWECQILHLWRLLVWLWMWLENVRSSTCGVFKSDYGCDLRMSYPPLVVSFSLIMDVTWECHILHLCLQGMGSLRFPRDQTWTWGYVVSSQAIREITKRWCWNRSSLPGWVLSISCFFLCLQCPASHFLLALNLTGLFAWFSIRLKWAWPKIGHGHFLGHFKW